MKPFARSTLEYVSRPDIAQDYDRYFAHNRLLGFDTEVLDEWLVDPGRLLDLGCGTGRHVLHFARRGFDVVGLDLSPHMLREARSKLERAGLKAHLVLGDVTEPGLLPMPAFRYAICMFSTIGMIRGSDRRAAFIRAVSRTLSPGALFVCHVHNLLYSAMRLGGPLWLLGSWVRSVRRNHELGDKWLEGYRGIHRMYLHVFRLAELKQLLREGGLEIEDIVCLAPSRDRRLDGGFLRGWRANGFIAIARKPHSGETVP